MRILQPTEWSKPRGFSHGVELDGPGRWIVLAGQTGGDEKGEYQSDMAAQVGTALRRITKLLGEAGAGPEHIVRLTWYLTSRSEYQAAGAGIGSAWRETLGKNFPPSTLLYISGLVDERAKVEIEVTAFVPADKQANALKLGQVDRGAAELAFRSDHNGLLVALRRQRKVRRETRRADDHLEIAVGSPPFELSVNAPAAFAPGARKHAAIGDDVALEIEPVTVAGADERLVEAVAARANGVGGTTSDPLGRSVVERDGSAARPDAGHAGERSRLRVACGA